MSTAIRAQASDEAHRPRAKAADVVVTRHPGDGIRTALGFAFFVAASLLLWSGADIAKVAEIVSETEQHLPVGADWVLAGVAAVGTPVVLVPAATLAALGAQMWRLARDVATAGVAAFLATIALNPLFDWILDSTELRGSAYPATVPITTFAVAAAAAPYFSKRAQHWFWASATIFTIASAFLNRPFIFAILGSAALGWMIGYAVHFAFGRPHEVIGTARVADALAKVGIAAPVENIASAADTELDTATFDVRTADGDDLFVKVQGRQQRDADWVFKLWRRIKLRRVEDEPLFGTPKQQLEREAFLQTLAAENGVNAPEIVAASMARSDETVLVRRSVGEQTLAQIESDALDDATLADAWEQLDAMHAAGIAHRDLRLANLVADDDGRVWITNFGWAQFAASDHSLSQDVAQLLASTAVKVGPDRAVAAATSALDSDVLRAAIPLLQPAAFPSSTGRAMRRNKELLAELRTAIAKAVAGDADSKERLGRVQVRTLIGIVGLGLAIYVIWPNLVSGQFRETLESWQGQNWVFIAGAALLAIGTYYAAAVQVMGSVPGAISLHWTVLSQVASDFMNVMAPAGLAGMGLTGAYIFKSGFTKTQATVAVTLRMVASFLVHITLLIAFIAILGSSGAQLFSVGDSPSIWIFVIIGVIVALIIAAFAWPWSRHRIVTPLVDGFRELRGLTHEPKRAALLFGGSVALLAFYATAFWFSELAFGADVSWVTAVTIYLGGSIVVLIWPVPGGVGAVELVLTAALVRAGVDSGTALAGVLTFRLLTFWLPIAPGYPAYRILERTGRI